MLPELDWALVTALGAFFEGKTVPRSLTTAPHAVGWSRDSLGKSVKRHPRVVRWRVPRRTTVAAASPPREEQVAAASVEALPSVFDLKSTFAKGPSAMMLLEELEGDEQKPTAAQARDRLKYRRHDELRVSVVPTAVQS
jgi:hypothetical protein